MSDMLTAPNDDLFWPPTQRTEAESPDVAMKADAWIFTFLGGRITSFSRTPDRVVVWCAAPLAIDAFTLPAAMRGATGPFSGCTMLPQGWEVSPVASSFTEATDPASQPTPRQLTNPAVEPETPWVPADEALQPHSDVEQALSVIKQLFGLTDEQVEAATGVSRSTLWRLRTGRTGETRSITEAPIWRLHGLARAMAERGGVEGVRSWLHAGDPSPAALLSSGQLGLVERAADELLFPDRGEPRSASAVADDDYAPVLPRSADVTAPVNRPRRARRPGDRPR
jgi:transcriptional regulator with XRE-family HTH domain